MISRDEVSAIQSLRVRVGVTGPLSPYRVRAIDRGINISRDSPCLGPVRNAIPD